MRSELPTDPVSPAEHRDFMAHFPTGVSVVTTVDHGGSPYGATCSSLTSICLAPATVLVSLTNHSQTLQRALTAGAFAIALLDDRSRSVADRFAMPGVDHFQGQDWTRSPLGMPWLIQNMTAAADCAVVRSIEVGDHSLLLGVVQQLQVVGGSPLIHGLREYWPWPEQP